MPPRLTLQGLEKKRHAPQTHHRQGSFFLSQLPCGHKPTQGLLITTNTTWSLGLAGGTHKLLTCPGGDIRSHQNPDPGGVGWGMAGASSRSLLVQPHTHSLGPFLSPSGDS